MFPLRRENECETIVKFLADTVAGRTNKVLAVVGNCGSGKTSSLTSIAQCFSTQAGKEMFEKFFDPSSSSLTTTTTAGSTCTPSAANSVVRRLPRLEYIHCAEKSFKVLLAEMTSRIKKPAEGGGFFSANVAPNAAANNSSTLLSAPKADANCIKRRTRTKRRKNCGDDGDSSLSDDSDADNNNNDQGEQQQQRKVGAALTMTVEQLKARFSDALVAQSCIGGVTNNYISGHGSVVDSTSIIISANKRRKIEHDDATTTSGSKRSNSTAVGVPFCFLVLDEIDTPGTGWRDAQSRELMERILGVKSIGIILIANRTDLKWLPIKMTHYLTFTPYEGDALAAIAKQKMSSSSGSGSGSSFDNQGHNNAQQQQQADEDSVAGKIKAHTFHDNAFVYAGRVAAASSGDARRVIDVCKTAAVNKMMSTRQKQLEEKRSREERERQEAEIAAASTSNANASASKASRATVRTSCAKRSDTRKQSSYDEPVANMQTSSSRPSFNNSDNSQLQHLRPTNMSNLTDNNNNNNNNDFLITIGDVASAAQSCSAHPGIEILPALPQHVHLALCCVANAVKVNLAAEQAQQQQFQQRNGTSSGGNSSSSSSSRKLASSNASSSLVELNNLYRLYQKLTRQLGINTVGLGNFRDSLGTLVDYQLLTVGSGNVFTLTVHQDEIEKALRQLGAMYLIADDLVRNAAGNDAAVIRWK